MSTALTLTPRHAVTAPAAARGEMDFATMMEMGQTLVQTGFLPNAIKTPAQAVAIIMTGRELGIPPMHALRCIHVIQGKPTLAAELQLAIFLRAGGKHEWRESDATRAVIWLRHPNGAEHVETFTFEEARAAGITGKDGWKHYPKAMLRARASSAGLRAIAPDIIGGIYDPEELGADVNAAGEIVPPTPSAPRTVRAPQPAPVAAQEVAVVESGEVTAAPPRQTPNDLARRAKQRKVDRAWLNEQVTTRDALTLEQAQYVQAKLLDESLRDADMGPLVEQVKALQAKAAKAAPTSEPPAAEGGAVPLCPECQGGMWDNRTSKTNPKAPDYKCKDRSCEGKYWPGQWPPKGDAIAADGRPELLDEEDLF